MRNRVRSTAAVLAAAVILSCLPVQAEESGNAASAASPSFIEEQKEYLRDALDLMDGMGISPMAVSEKLFGKRKKSESGDTESPAAGWEAIPGSAGSTEPGEFALGLQEQAAEIGDKITDTAAEKVQSGAKSLGERIRKSVEDAVVSWVQDLFN